MPLRVLHRVERGHHLVGRVERERRDPRVLLPGERRIDAALGGQHDQGAFGRIADELAAADLGVGAQGHRKQVLLERDLRLAAGVGDLAGRLVAVAADRIAPADDRHLDGRHLVEGQRPRLVGVERGGRPERLDRAQSLHDRAGRGQRLGSLRQDGRDDRRERGRDRRDRERDCAEEQLLGLDAPVQAKADRDHERDAGDDQDLVRQRVQLLRQRGLLDRGGLEHAADVADLGGHPRGHHEDGARSPGDLAVHERHVHPVAERGVGRDRVHLLGRGDALAGERGLVDLEGRGGQDARVGRDEVARLDVDDVAGDELVHRELDEIAIAPDLRLDDHHLLEGRGARLGLALLVHGHPGVEQREQQQEDARVELTGQEEADDARDEEHELHRVRVLADEHLHGRRLLRRGEGVRAVLRTPRLGLGGRQARSIVTD